MAELKSKLKGIRAQLGRDASNYTKRSQSQRTKNYLSGRIEILEDNFKTAREVNKEAITSLEAEPLEEASKVSDCIQELYLDYRAIMLDAMDKHAERVAAETPVTAPVPEPRNVQDKSTQQKKKTAAGKSCSSCGCKWFLGSIVLMAIIAGVLHYDTNTNGKGVFANSATGKLLKNAGLLPHVEKGYVVVMTNTTACNAFGLVKDYAVAALDSYIPGLPQKLENVTVSTRVFISDSVGRITEFVKVNVFLGSFFLFFYLFFIYLEFQQY